MRDTLGRTVIGVVHGYVGKRQMLWSQVLIPSGPDLQLVRESGFSSSPVPGGKWCMHGVRGTPFCSFLACDNLSWSLPISLYVDLKNNSALSTYLIALYYRGIPP
jgi:hypothetical protein